MERIHRGVVTLLRSAITGEKLQLADSFSLEEADALIKSQSLLPLVYRGAYLCGISPKTELMQRYKQLYFQHMMRSAQQMRALELIYAAFEANCIDYLPLKGSKLKGLYPQPELRPMGDADILIRLEQYEKIKPLMLELGFKEDHESSYDLCWQSSALYVELHKRMFGPNQMDLCSYFGIGWERALPECGFLWTLSHEDEFVYIFSHMAKHFRFCGIGARQIVDLYVYRKAYPEMDESKIEMTMAKLGLLEFYKNIRYLLRVWFEGEQSNPVCECITDFVFRSGNFGTTQNKLYAEELLKANKSGTIRNAKWKSFWQMLFLPLSDMQLSYNILYKCPILLPVFWVVRWFDVLINRRQNISRKLRIVREMNDEKVETHRKLMEFMGLRYDYEVYENTK